jgi:nucleotide-binding universal stress UspA family protein
MRILLAVDGSPPSQVAIDEVARRPWPAPSSVRVITAVRLYVPPAAEFVPAAAPPAAIWQQHDEEAAHIAARAADRIAKAGLPVDTVTRHGDPRTVIVDEAKHWAAELIVVGSHGRTGVSRLLLGSVAQAVVAHAPCSVEVVRRRESA